MRGSDRAKQAPAFIQKEYTMNYKLTPDSIIKLFNNQIGRLRPRKIKTLTLAFLLVGALVTSISAPVRAAGPSLQPADTFSILLSGPYKQVDKGHGPDLGLTTVDLSDGSFSTTKIF